MHWLREPLTFKQFKHFELFESGVKTKATSRLTLVDRRLNMTSWDSEVTLVLSACVVKPSISQQLLWLFPASPGKRLRVQECVCQCLHLLWLNQP